MEEGWGVSGDVGRVVERVDKTSETFKSVSKLSQITSLKAGMSGNKAMRIDKHYLGMNTIKV